MCVRASAGGRRAITCTTQWDGEANAEAGGRPGHGLRAKLYVLRELPTSGLIRYMTKTRKERNASRKELRTKRGP